MSANLFGNRFASLRQPAWHGLGKVFENEMDLVSAFELAGLNYNCNLSQIFVLDDGGNYLNTDEFRGVVRETIDDSPAELLAVVSDHYNLLQNMEIARALNPISEIYPVETCGALGKGGEVFAALNAGEYEFMGDAYSGYFTLYENKLAKGKVKLFYTPVRVVCQNTLRLALAESTVTVSIRHSKNAGFYLENVAEYIVRMNRAVDSTKELFGGLVHAKYSLDDFQEFVKSLYSISPEIKSKGKAREIILDEPDSEMMEISEAGELAIDLFKRFSDEFPQFGNTRYAALQAIVENEDYRIPGRGPQNTNYSSMFGSRATLKMKAQQILSKGI